MTLLYLDIDGRLPATMHERLTRTLRLWRWPVEAIRYDRTKRGWHVIIAVRKRLCALTMVAAQAILGSDPKREAFNLIRVRQLRVSGRRAHPWNVLYSHHHRGVIL